MAICFFVRVLLVQYVTANFAAHEREQHFCFLKRYGFVFGLFPNMLWQTMHSLIPQSRFFRP
jgi:hypothetical protein